MSSSLLLTSRKGLSSSLPFLMIFILPVCSHMNSLPLPSFACAMLTGETRSDAATFVLMVKPPVCAVSWLEQIASRTGTKVRSFMGERRFNGLTLHPGLFRDLFDIPHARAFTPVRRLKIILMLEDKRHDEVNDYRTAES